MALEAFPLWLENAGPVYHARQYRRMIERLIGYDFATSPGAGAGGIARPGDLVVTQRGAGANMSVDVSAGGAFVRGDDASGQGVYFVYNDATVNLAVSASHGSDDRIDLVGIHVRDTEYSGANDDSRLLVVDGTPAGSPSEPSLSGHPNFLTLASILVEAASADVVNADITDQRRMVAALGGTVVCTSTTRPSVNLFEGLMIWETDTNRHRVYDGTGWLVLSEPWQTWTATITQSGTVAHTPVIAQYRRTRTMCECELLTTFSGSGSSDNSIQISVPVSVFSSENFVSGVGTWLDNSSGRKFRGTVRSIVGAVFDIQWDRSLSLDALGSDGSDYDSLTNPAEAALASGDSISIHARYPISDANARA